MPSFEIDTPQRKYRAIVGRGVLERAGEHIPDRVGKVFVLTTPDVWQPHCARLAAALTRHSHEILMFPGGEEKKRLSTVEALAEEMVRRGGDRASLVIAFGGGVVNDVGGFLAAVFMRGIPVLQIPTTLLAQVDAAIGGKTGVDLVSGKNLVGAFHQPIAVLIDPDVLATLPEREYRSGLFEILKCALLGSPSLFELLTVRRDDVLARYPEAVEQMISECVRIKAEVVSADEKESGPRMVLNLGHTVGHALEAETGYTLFRHGEAVGFGLRAAAYLARRTGHLAETDASIILSAIEMYGPIPPFGDVTADALSQRLLMDKKNIRGQVHWVLPKRVGEVEIVTGIGRDDVQAAIQEALS